MPNAVSRLGDHGVHSSGAFAGVSGIISTATGSAPTNADSIQVAVAGDTYTCGVSAHNSGNVLIPFPTSVTVGGKGIITVNATTTCGATIIEGSSDVTAA